MTLLEYVENNKVEGYINVYVHCYGTKFLKKIYPQTVKSITEDGCWAGRRVLEEFENTNTRVHIEEYSDEYLSVYQKAMKEVAKVVDILCNNLRERELSDKTFNEYTALLDEQFQKYMNLFKHLKYPEEETNVQKR